MRAGLSFLVDGSTSTRADAGKSAGGGSERNALARKELRDAPQVRGVCIRGQSEMPVNRRIL